ncbi:MAG: hypothetical protein U0636_13425, partial [Phycisphaerales bacterium]
MSTARFTSWHVLQQFDQALGLQDTLRSGAAPAGLVAPMGHPAPAGPSARAAIVEPRPEQPSAPEATASTLQMGAWALPTEWLLNAGEPAQRAARLASIQAAHAAGCPHCTVAAGWHNMVFG